MLNSINPTVLDSLQMRLAHLKVDLRVAENFEYADTTKIKREIDFTEVVIYLAKKELK